MTFSLSAALFFFVNPEHYAAQVLQLATIYLWLKRYWYVVQTLWFENPPTFSLFLHFRRPRRYVPLFLTIPFLHYSRSKCTKGPINIEHFLSWRYFVTFRFSFNMFYLHVNATSCFRQLYICINRQENVPVTTERHLSVFYCIRTHVFASFMHSLTTVYP